MTDLPPTDEAVRASAELGDSLLQLFARLCHDGWAGRGARGGNRQENDP